MANKLVLGKNDFVSWCKLNNSNLIDEWDYKKNEIDPSQIQYGSSKKIYWIGKCGHSFLASLNKRTSDKTGCPYCSNYHAKLLPGFNDLATTNPEICQLWDYEKNYNLTPKDVMKGQHKKVWWKGKCGHSWEATIYHIVGGRGCPICRKESKTSFPEQAIYYFVKKYYSDAINGDRHLGKELDIFIPSIKVAIEYDGQRWHTDIKKDEEKNRLCRENGIVLYRIREKDCWFWSEDDYLRLIPCESANEKELENAIQCLFIFLNGPLFCKISINEEKVNIYNQYIKSRKNNSLLEKNFKLASEWNTEKNGDLTPDMVTVNSGKKVWWRANCNHEWEATIASRNRTGCGCPYCNGNRLLKGENDLETLNPSFLKEWDYDKNTVTPDNYTLHSNEKVFWKCSKCGNSFITSVNNRSKGHNCAKCSRALVSERYRRGEIVNSKPKSRSDNSSHKKSVVNIDTGEVFNSLKEAGEFYNIAPNRISECCSGKRKTAGKYHWKYYLR